MFKLTGGRNSSVCKQNFFAEILDSWKSWLSQVEAGFKRKIFVSIEAEFI